MKFCSTRGGTKKGLSFEEVIAKGYALDGGMFFPETVPRLPDAELERWSNLPYVDIVFEVFKIFIDGEMPDADLKAIVVDAYSTFNNPTDPIPIKQLSGELSMMEMYHGRSLAFKDLSMTITVRLLQYFLNKRNEKACMIIATSGDTGSSALEAVRDLEGIQCIVLIPTKLVSNVQLLQMTTVVADNCYVVKSAGNSDELDIVINRLSRDEEFTTQHKIGSLNSVNVARMIAQTAHHFFAYFQAKKGRPDSEVKLVIPTGGLGNATSACLAIEMGLPVKLVCAVTNDALCRAVYDNDFSLRDLYVSLAPAINIQCPYNYERIVYLFSGFDDELVKTMMDEYDQQQKSSPIPEHVIKRIQEVFTVMKISDDEILNTIKACTESNSGYLVCPHTATALCAANKLRENDKNTALMVYAAASPAKFSDVFPKAGVEYTGVNLEDKLLSSPQRSVEWTENDDMTELLKELVIKATT